MNLKNKTVLVTGSSTGIGRAIAEAFAKEGANVILNYRNNKTEGEKVLSELKNYEGKSTLIQADMAKEEDVKRLFKEIEKGYGVLDILVNNAGDAQGIDVLSSDIKDWEYQMDNNYLSAVMASREFLKMKGSAELRKIINISSVYGFDDKCHADYMAYGASKAAINSLTKNMAKKFAPNVLINAIAPGYVMTPHWGEMSGKEVKENADQQLIQRFIEPSEIAEGAIFLGKNDSMTGTIILMDGGISLKTV
ncbi:MAG: SDR family NAD(P)-dependent oxidoreductase [Candidatus Dojkabacteria bacterium]